MAEFNNTNLADFSGVWVFCEQRQGESPANRTGAHL